MPIQQAFFCQEKLLCLGGSHGADIGAVAALDAGVGVDDEDAVTLGDGFHGALTGAGAAGDALIGDLVCHTDYLLTDFQLIIPYADQNAMGSFRAKL